MAYTAIDDSSAHFQAEIYTGTGSSLVNTFDGNSDMQPDFVWIKERNGTADHALYDSSRGVQKQLECNENTVETSESTGLTAFGSDGFTVGALAQANTSSDTYVAWCWKANGSTRSTFAESGDNPGGGYQVNTTAGFSIVDYTGTGAAGTISHGLGAKPEFIAVKNREATEDWTIYHHKNTAAPETDYLRFNTTAATADATVWNDTAPTTSVFSVGTDAKTNSDGVTYIAYCWVGVQGFSKFGTYAGTGAANGPFIHTGFKPAFVILNSVANAGYDWAMLDNRRTPYNGEGIAEWAWLNLSAAEFTDTDSGLDIDMDLYSNGFKLTTSRTENNGDGHIYIYTAWAESPFVTSGGIPVTGR